MNRDASCREADLQDEYWGVLADDNGTPNIRFGDAILEIARKTLRDEEALVDFMLKTLQINSDQSDQIRAHVSRGSHRRSMSGSTSAMRIMPTPGEYRLTLVKK